jgi:subtilase family serine protease
MRFDIVLALRHQPELLDFLADIYDPSSPNYRRYVTPEQFTERFGPSQEDFDAVLQFANANGLTVTGGSRDSMDIQMIGTVGAVERAFHMQINRYQHLTEDRSFFAPDREPTVELPFQLWHVTGLDNYSIPRPTFVRRTVPAQSNATTGSGPSASFLGQRHARRLL